MCTPNTWLWRWSCEKMDGQLRVCLLAIVDDELASRKQVFSKFTNKCLVHILRILAMPCVSSRSAGTRTPCPHLRRTHPTVITSPAPSVTIMSGPPFGHVAVRLARHVAIRLVPVLDAVMTGSLAMVIPAMTAVRLVLALAMSVSPSFPIQTTS